MAQKLKVTDKVRKVVQPIADKLGYDIWDIDFVKEGTLWILRIEIDKEGGVFIDDCEKMSKAINKPLDELDPIKQSYILEVSSPGIDRRLSRPEHFQKMTGQKILIRLIRPKDGVRELIGTLKDFKDGQIYFNTHDGISHIINIKETASIRLYAEGLTQEFN